MRIKFSIFTLILFTALLSSCAGYKIRDRGNPFADQGIRSIVIPTFVNKTSVNELTPLVTKEVVNTFSQFHGLRVNVGEMTNEDAVVVGIIRPGTKANREVVYQNNTLMNTDQQEAIGNRNAFYVPTIGAFDTKVQVIILKRPTKEEIAFFTDYFNLPKNSFPRTIINESFDLKGTFSIENPVGDLDSSAPVRGTKNAGNLRKALEDNVKSFGVNLRELIANAF
jgi:hypothetical protein